MLNSPENRVVVVGAGQAGTTLAATLRERGWRGGISLIGSESHDPYQRPPLSKGYLSGTEGVADLALSSSKSRERDGIEFIAGRSVVRLDTAARVAVLDDDLLLPYAAAVLATGARPRALPIPGAALPGVHMLRTIGDAQALQVGISNAQNVVVIGGGFVGLEVASAIPEGVSVTVVEGASRILARAISEPVSTRLHEEHEARGKTIWTGIGVSAFEADAAGNLVGVTLSDGRTLPADLVLVAVGAAPDVAVAERSGIDALDGILTDEQLRTSAEDVWAIGDCARYPSFFIGEMARLESVQNATDQARYVAEALTGGVDGPYRALPWFWSHQAGLHLQIAGLALATDDAEVVESTSDTLVVHRIRGGVLVAVETVGSPRAHVRARRELAASVQ